MCRVRIEGSDEFRETIPTDRLEFVEAAVSTPRQAKRRVYARHGVRELWLVDPTLRQIHLYDFARDPARAVRILDDDELFDSALLPGLMISAAEVFKR